MYVACKIYYTVKIFPDFVVSNYAVKFFPDFLIPHYITQSVLRASDLYISLIRWRYFDLHLLPPGVKPVALRRHLGLVWTTSIGPAFTSWISFRSMKSVTAKRQSDSDKDIQYLKTSSVRQRPYTKHTIFVWFTDTTTMHTLDVANMSYFHLNYHYACVLAKPKTATVSFYYLVKIKCICSYCRR